MFCACFYREFKCHRSEHAFSTIMKIWVFMLQPLLLVSFVDTIVRIYLFIFADRCDAPGLESDFAITKPY